MAAIKEYERTLAVRLVSGARAIPGVTIYGIADEERFAWRTPTLSFTMDGLEPAGIARRLAQAGICVWSGNYYALAIMERLGLEARGGAVRAGLALYNTMDEVERFLKAVEALA
jgi:selenocysteine lyase/cysteine desulfurase